MFSNYIICCKRGPNPFDKTLTVRDLGRYRSKCWRGMLPIFVCIIDPSTAWKDFTTILATKDKLTASPSICRVVNKAIFHPAAIAEEI